MSQALRLEMVEHGIRVTNVQPGDVETELASHSTDKEVNYFVDYILIDILLIEYALDIKKGFPQIFIYL